MILTKELTLKANRGNLGLLRKHNKDIKKGDIINIPVDSLPYSSTQLIKVSCDICGVELETTYYNYTRNIKKYNLYTCHKCKDFKSKITCQEKYGVDNVMYDKDIIEKHSKVMKEVFTEKHDEIQEKPLIQI